MDINQMNNNLDEINQFIPIGLVMVDNDDDHRPFVDFDNLQAQVVSIAGQQINANQIQMSGHHIRYARVEGMQYGIQRVQLGDNVDHLAVGKPVAGPPGRPWRTIHTYGFNGNGGPQAMSVEENGQQLLFMMNETTVQAIRELLYTDQSLHNCMRAAISLSGLGITIFDLNIHNNAHLNEVKNRVIESMLDLDYVIPALTNMEYIFQRTVVHNPRVFVNQQVPVPPIEMDPLPEPDVANAMHVNLETMNIFQEIRNNLANDPNNLFVTDWHQILTDDFAVLEHSITLNEGIHEVELDYGNHNLFNDHNLFDVHVINDVHNNRIRLESFRFTYANLPPDILHVPYYLIGEDGAPGLLVYRDDTDTPDDLIPVYSHGTHGAHPDIGCNGWQAMTLELHVADNEERVWFMTRAMAAQLCQWFEEWEVLLTYRLWIRDLARFAALLLQMQRFANDLVGNIAQQIRDELADHRNWLIQTRQQVYLKYMTLMTLEKLYRHSILVPDRPAAGHVDQLTCLDAWPQNVPFGPPLEEHLLPRARGRPRAPQQQQQNVGGGRGRGVNGNQIRFPAPSAITTTGSARKTSSNITDGKRRANTSDAERRNKRLNN